MLDISRDVALLILVVALMVLPRILQRWRMPPPLTSFGLGLLTLLTLGNHSDDSTLSLLATFGIASIFLFAGLEVEWDDLKRGRWPLVRHIVLRALMLGMVTYGLMHFLGFAWQAGVLLGLAVLTPSAGFILDTLSALDLDEDERYWIRMKAVSGELFALVVLFVVLKSESIGTLVWSTGALLAMIAALPLMLLGLGKAVLPYAKGSEFSLLVMVAVIAATLTYKLGVYYLVGAFLVGLVAKLLHKRLPALAAEDNMHAVRMFASFFLPFYFFHKGMGVPTGAMTWEALGLGLGLTALVLPLRVGLLWLQRRFIRGESVLASLRVSAALTPTLIFTLVLASILRERYGVSETVYGALLVYAGLSTLMPSLVLPRAVTFDVLTDPVQPPSPSPATPPENAPAPEAPPAPVADR